MMMMMVMMMMMMMFYDVFVFVLIYVHENLRYDIMHLHMLNDKTTHINRQQYGSNKSTIQYQIYLGTLCFHAKKNHVAMQRKDQAPWVFLSADFEESKSEEIELAVRLEREKEEELEDLKQRLGPLKKNMSRKITVGVLISVTIDGNMEI